MSTEDRKFYPLTVGGLFAGGQRVIKYILSVMYRDVSVTKCKQLKLRVKVQSMLKASSAQLDFLFPLKMGLLFPNIMKLSENLVAF